MHLCWRSRSWSLQETILKGKGCEAEKSQGASGKDTRRWSSLNQEADPHQTSNLPALRSWTCGLQNFQGITGCWHCHSSPGSVAMEPPWPAAMAGGGAARESVKLHVNLDASSVSAWDQTNVDAFQDTPGKPAVKM